MNRAEQQAARMRNCGLVYHERQSDGTIWIGPPQQHQDGHGRVKVLALTDVQPKPLMVVHAHDEKYQIPHDFRGTWFDVESPTGKALIQ